MPNPPVPGPMSFGSLLPVVALASPRAAAGARTSGSLALASPRAFASKRPSPVSALAAVALTAAPADPRLWRAYVDGGAHPNPEGVMGIGVVVIDPDGKVVSEVAYRPKQLGTNNEAEYLAVLRAITEAQTHGAEHLEVCADSKLTVNTLSGRWRLKAPHLLPIKDTIDQAAKGMGSVRYRWVPREQNKHADRLATEAIGGTVGGASKYGKNKAAPGKPAGTQKAAPERPQADGILCGACRDVCTLKWQVFSNGQTALRQECPTHGFLRFAPKVHPFTEVAGPEPKAADKTRR